MSDYSPAQLAEYAVLVDGAGFLPWNRSVVRVAQKDRLEFLQNMLSNDFRLQPGQGCEAFVADVQGKIVAYVWALIRDDDVLLLAEPGAAPRIMGHLERYLIREDVELTDDSEQWRMYLACGKSISQRLGSLCEALPGPPLHHVAGRPPVQSIARSPWSDGDAYLLLTTPQHAGALENELKALGVAACSEDWDDVLRVFNKLPLHGRDITERNLPQEVDRNEQAISFRKGCYLGQETVARIDAMGHVNWLLRRLLLPGGEQDPSSLRGGELTRDGKTVARLGSVVVTPVSDGPRSLTALAMVRRQDAAPGGLICDQFGEITVLD